MLQYEFFSISNWGSKHRRWSATSGIKTFEKSLNLYTQPQSGPKWNPSKTYTLPFYFILLALVQSWISQEEVRSSQPGVFCKKGVIRNCAKFWHRCFPVNFAKFLRTPFFTEHLRWLLLEGYTKFWKKFERNTRLFEISAQKCSIYIHFFRVSELSFWSLFLGATF